MKQWILGSVSAATLIAVPAAGWTLTAQQAWDNWQTLASGYGQTLTNDGEQSMGGKLTVNGVGISSVVEDTSIAIRIDQLVFAEQGDGTVEITMSESFPMAISGTSEDGEQIDGVVTFTQSGLKMVASDADGGTAFTYDAPSIGVNLSGFMIDDKAFPMTVMASLKGVVGAYSVGGSVPVVVESDVSATNLDIDVKINDPEGDGTMDMTVAIADLASTSTGQGMDIGDVEDFAKALQDGFAVEGSARYGAVDFAMDFQDQSESAKANGSLTGGEAGFVLNADTMAYDVAYNGLDITVSGSQIPFPQVTAKADSVGTKLAMPVQETDMAAPFALRLAFEGLAVGEEIWSMIDPAAILPRDPATLIVDLAGTGRWMIDIFDEQAMMDVETSGETPGQLETVDINELKLSIGGAELTGNGAFKIDNADVTTFEGMPRPEGSASLRLVGGNGLLENLTKMGLVPEDQVMMVRMMTGMFAKPGAGPDELLSEIAVDSSGKVLINGAPMPF